MSFQGAHGFPWIFLDARSLRSLVGGAQNLRRVGRQEFRDDWVCSKGLLFFFFALGFRFISFVFFVVSYVDVSFFLRFM